MRFTPSEIEQMIENIKIRMDGLCPIDPEFMELDYDLDNLYRELQMIEDDMARLHAEDDHYQEDFID
jgi:hypothetical protein